MGLRWSDVDLDRKRLTICQTISMAGDRPEVGHPEDQNAGGDRCHSTMSPRPLSSGGGSAQNEERLLIGGRAGQGAEHDLIVTEPDGSPIHPQVLTRRFHAATKAAKLPVIRLHDVRHSYATAALASGGAGEGAGVEARPRLTSL